LESNVSSEDVLSRGGFLTRSRSLSAKEEFLEKIYKTALYSFYAGNDDEVDLVEGDRVEIVDRVEGWMIVNNAGKTGYVPESYLE